MACKVNAFGKKFAVCGYGFPYGHRTGRCTDFYDCLVEWERYHPDGSISKPSRADFTTKVALRYWDLLALLKEALKECGSCCLNDEEDRVTVLKKLMNKLCTPSNEVR